MSTIISEPTTEDRIRFCFFLPAKDEKEIEFSREKCKLIIPLLVIGLTPILLYMAFITSHPMAVSIFVVISYFFIIRFYGCSNYNPAPGDELEVEDEDE